MKAQSTTKGFAILSLAGIIVKVLSLLYIPLLIAIIGNAGHGIYSAAYDVFSLIYVMTNAGMQIAIAKQVAEMEALGNHKDAIKTFKIARSVLLAMGFIMGMILIIFARPLANIINYPDAYYAIIALAPAVVVTSVLAAYRGYFQGLSNMTPTAVSQIVEQVFNIALSLLFAYLLMKKGIPEGVAGGTIGTTIGALVAGVYLIKKYKASKIYKSNKVLTKDEAPIRRFSNKQILKKLFKYGIPITLSSGMQYIGAVIDTAIVASRLVVAGFVDDNLRAEKNSVLSRYRALIYVPLTIIQALSSAVLPAISRAVTLKDRKTVKEKIDFALKISYIVSIPSAVGLAVLSKEIYRILHYNIGSDIMTYGSIVVVFMAVVQIQTTILQSINKLYIVLVSLGIGIIAKLLSNYFLIAIPAINVNGAVIGGILGFFIPMIINNIAIKKALKVRISLLKNAIKPTVASILMGIVVYISNKNFHAIALLLGNGYVISTIFTFICIFLGGFVYIYGLVLTGGITKKDINSMPSKVNRLLPGFVRKRLR